jgi:hypothetical protein
LFANNPESTVFLIKTINIWYYTAEHKYKMWNGFNMK